VRDKEGNSRTFGLSIRKLLILELVGVVPYKGHGSGSTDYILRRWSMEFFVEAFKMFDIRIWCAIDAKTTLTIVRSIFCEETIKKVLFCEIILAYFSKKLVLNLDGLSLQNYLFQEFGAHLGSNPYV
jgi:hypothetical protein